MSFYSYDLKEPEIFDVLNQILLDAETDLFKTHKTGTVTVKAVRARRSNIYLIPGSCLVTELAV
jgi:hypothetical protein